MPSVTMPPRAGDYILSEANGTRSRENAILDTGNLQAGTVLGKITATSKYVQLAPAATDGSEIAAAILFRNADATAGDQSIVVSARDTELRAELLIWPVGITGPQKAAAIDNLNDVGMYVR